MEKRKIPKVIFAAICFLILILDSKTALSGARQGLYLCLNSVIPALFLFCILSKILCSALLGCQVPLFSLLGKITGMPAGTESILMLSLLGGYPIGAQCIDDAYKNGSILKKDAQRLLSFCSNAGPAFLFGIVGSLFPTIGPVFYLSAIHIISAVLVGILMPGKSAKAYQITRKSEMPLVKATEESVRTMIGVCSWIIIFRVILEFISVWFIKRLRNTAFVITAGFLELSNGCLMLENLSNLGLRFILASVFLAFGGSCVALQTISVTKHCGIGLYFPGKILQSAISLILATLSQFIVFTDHELCPHAERILLLGTLLGAFLLFFLYKSKKVVAFAK